MHVTFRLFAASAVAACAIAAPAASVHANDFPTLERVRFVEQCMRDHPDATRAEMMSKCSCAQDAIAAEVSFEEYDTLITATDATTIGGERGGYIRDAPALQDGIRKYRKLREKAYKGCFITP